MLRIATVNPTSLVFVANNDTDLRVFADAMTGANPHVISILDSPDRLGFRGLDVQYTVPEGEQPVSPAYSRDAFALPTPGATKYGVALTFSDTQDKFWYEDIRSIITHMNSRGMGDKPLLLSEKTVQDLLQYARTNLEAHKTLFFPNADNPTLEVDAESGVSIRFNQHHPRYDPVRARATSLELSLAVDPNAEFRTSDVTRLAQGTYLTSNNGGNSVDDLTTIQAITAILVKNDWLAPSEAEDFIHDVRAARVSSMATSMLCTAKRNVQIGYNFEAGQAINQAETVKQLTPLLTILSELRQAGDFSTLSREQLETLSLINQKRNYKPDARESRSAGEQAFSELTRGFHNRDELSAMLLRYAPEIALTRSIEANAIGAAQQTEASMAIVPVSYASGLGRLAWCEKV